MRPVAQWGQLYPQRCAVSTYEALLGMSASIGHSGDNGPNHALTGRALPLFIATARAIGPLTKVVSDLDAACGAVGAAVASDVRGEYTQSAPPFVRFHSHRGDRGATHSHRACAAAASCNCYSCRAAHQSWQWPRRLVWHGSTFAVICAKLSGRVC